MVWLTVGIYGNSITDSKQAMFTDTPVTVPARSLMKRKRDKTDGQIVNLNVRSYLLAVHICTCFFLELIS